jgi:hypothetical protein
MVLAPLQISFSKLMAATTSRKKKKAFEFVLRVTEIPICFCGDNEK